MGKKYQRMNGESMPQFQARIAAAQAAERMAIPQPIKRQRRKRNTSQSSWSRNADHVDGYDRDDLGESHDY